MCAGAALLPVAMTRRFRELPHGLDGVSATPPEDGLLNVGVTWKV